jgi:hypothetical protein
MKGASSGGDGVVDGSDADLVYGLVVAILAETSDSGVADERRSPAGIALQPLSEMSLWELEFRGLVHPLFPGFGESVPGE